MVAVVFDVHFFFIFIFYQVIVGVVLIAIVEMMMLLLELTRGKCFFPKLDLGVLSFRQ